jgi:hypothetical protein
MQQRQVTWALAWPPDQIADADIGIRDARFDGRLWMADPMLNDGSEN